MHVYIEYWGTARPGSICCEVNLVPLEVYQTVVHTLLIFFIA